MTRYNSRFCKNSCSLYTGVHETGQCSLVSFNVNKNHHRANIKIIVLPWMKKNSMHFNILTKKSEFNKRTKHINIRKAKCELNGSKENFRKKSLSGLIFFGKLSYLQDIIPSTRYKFIASINKNMCCLC